MDINFKKGVTDIGNVIFVRFQPDDDDFFPHDQQDAVIVDLAQRRKNYLSD